MAIHKSRHASNFTTLPNEIFTHGLSMEAIGLLAYFLSLPHDWVIYKTQIHSQMDIGREKMDRIFKELQDVGYILSVQKRTEKTKKIEWEHIVYDRPYNGEPEPVKPLTAEPLTALPHTANQPLLSTNNTNKQLQINNIKPSSPSQVQEVTAVQKIIDLKVTEHSCTEDKIINAFHKFFCAHRTKPGIPFSHKTLLNAKLKDWHKDLRLLMKTDKRSIDDLRSMLEFLKTSKDPFWRDTVYSLGGIRKNYDTIWDKMQAESVKAKEKKPEVKEGVFQGNIKRVTK